MGTEEMVHQAFDWFMILKDFVVALVAFGTAWLTQRKWIMQPIKKQAERDQQQNAKIDALMHKVDKIESNCADIMWDRLSSLHDMYCYELGWCSAAEKARICQMHRRYKDAGYDHLAATYEEEVMKLPEHPSDKK